MSKQDIKRALLHLPVGIFAAWLILTSPVLGVVFGVTFLTYEIMNDWRKKDWSYKDIYGYCWGLAIGSLLIFV